MSRVVRYQAAIIRDGRILLLRWRPATGRDYWVIPGGGRDEGESEEECVIREAKEETRLDVAVERLLLDESASPGDTYRRLKTYLCIPLAGEAGPGYEPEPEASNEGEFAEVAWFDLRNEATWAEKLITDQITYPLMQRIRAALGLLGSDDMQA